MQTSLKIPNNETMLTKKEVLNFPISLGTYSEFVDEVIKLAESGRSSYVCVAAVHQLIEAHKDASFAQTSRQADLASADGMPIKWALKLLYNIKQDRIAGMDLLPSLLKQADQKSLAVYFYGGTQKMLDLTNNHVRQNYPNIRIAGSDSPPFRALTEAENDNYIQRINDSKANLVFVVLGCPKQERWMYQMKGRVQATMVGIGGAVPVMVGIQKRAPIWMQNAGLEWLYRLGQEPRRLWKRYMSTNSLFIYLVIAEKLRSMFYSAPPIPKTKTKTQ